MASATTPKPQKKLAEFLKEPQEPFVLQVYLLERRYSKKWSTPQDQEGASGHSYGESSKSLQRSASSASSKKRKSPLSFSRVLTAVWKKLASHNESTVTRHSHQKDEDIISVPQTDGVDQNQNQNQDHQMVVETDRLSSTSRSTVFNSCSEIDEIEEETWMTSHKDQPSFVSDTGQASNVHNIAVQSQRATNNGKSRRRYLEDSLAFLGRIPSCRVQVSQNNERVNEEAWRMEKSIPNSGGLAMPKKITEDSLLSAALWGLLIQTAKTDNDSMELREILGPNVSQTLKSKRALHKTKQLLFDCVREIAVSFPRKDEEQIGHQQLLEAEGLGNLVCHRLKEWGQQAGHQTNMTYLLTLDHLNSINEWSSDLEPNMKDISFEIADAILERISNETVSEMIEIFTPNI